jgi:hypothetical protein
MSSVNAGSDMAKPELLLPREWNPRWAASVQTAVRLLSRIFWDTLSAAATYVLVLSWSSHCSVLVVHTYNPEQVEICPSACLERLLHRPILRALLVPIRYLMYVVSA